jgi:hypothetical protein
MIAKRLSITFIFQKLCSYCLDVLDSNRETLASKL